MAGAGKSTFSRQLAAKSGLPVIHLDLHSWAPGWVRVPDDELLETQRTLLAGERWIVDSNDVDDDLLVARADTLVVITTPWWVCSWRAFRRGLRRPAATQLPEGCDESFSQRIVDEWGIAWRETGATGRRLPRTTGVVPSGAPTSWTYTCCVTSRNSPTSCVGFPRDPPSSCPPDPAAAAAAGGASWPTTLWPACPVTSARRTGRCP